MLSYRALFGTAGVTVTFRFTVQNAKCTMSMRNYHTRTPQKELATATHFAIFVQGYNIRFERRFYNKKSQLSIRCCIQPDIVDFRAVTYGDGE